MTVQISRRLFTVDEYHQMAKTGVLSESDRVELMNGEIFEMSPIGRRHAACVNRVNRLLSRQLGDLAIISVQNPIALGQHSEPQPDVALLRPRDDFYASGLPGPSDVLLVIEVAETSIEYDRAIKIPQYAEFAIRETWLIDLLAEQIQVYRSPGGVVYRDVQTVSRQGLIEVPVVPSVQLPVAQLLG